MQKEHFENLNTENVVLIMLYILMTPKNMQKESNDKYIIWKAFIFS